MYTLPNYSKYLMFGQNMNVSYRVTSNIYGNEIRAKYLCRVIKKSVVKQIQMYFPEQFIKKELLITAKLVFQRKLSLRVLCISKALFKPLKNLKNIKLIIITMDFFTFVCSKRLKMMRLLIIIETQMKYFLFIMNEPKDIKFRSSTR